MKVRDAKEERRQNRSGCNSNYRHMWIKKTRIMGSNQHDWKRIVVFDSMTSLFGRV